MPKKTTSSVEDLVGEKPVKKTVGGVKKTAKKAVAKTTSTTTSTTTTTSSNSSSSPIPSQATTTTTTTAPSSEVAAKRIPVMPLRSPAARVGANGNGRGRSHPMRGRNNGRNTRNGRNPRNNRNGAHNSVLPDGRFIPDMNEPTETVSGFLDVSRDGHGVLRAGFSDDPGDAYISNSQIKRFRIRPGDYIEGPARRPKDNERYWGLLRVDSVNGEKPEELMKSDRTQFYRLTPVFPDEQIHLEIGAEPLSLRTIDLIAPIGKGQRSLIVSPPKAGKTTLLKNIATGVAKNYPKIHLMAVLVGERPEEVTDIRRHIETLTKGKGEVAASNFDENPDEQTRVAELALERAKRLVEEGKDVLILLDSITRLARAYNLSIPTSGRTLSGGFDPAALHPPKRFFGAARNFEVPGSLTIIGTALVDTGSRMDDLIYEEFKGTGNQEIHLSRRMAERRVFPAIDVQRSGTRRDDLLMDSMTYQSIATLHRMLDTLDKDERTNTFLMQLGRTKTNKDFLATLKEG